MRFALKKIYSKIYSRLSINSLVEWKRGYYLSLFLPSCHTTDVYAAVTLGSIHFKPPDDDGRYYIGGSKSSWQISSLSYESSRVTTPAKKKKKEKRKREEKLLHTRIVAYYSHMRSKYDVCRNEERREGREK